MAQRPRGRASRVALRRLRPTRRAGSADQRPRGSTPQSFVGRPSRFPYVARRAAWVSAGWRSIKPTHFGLAPHGEVQAGESRKIRLAKNTRSWPSTRGSPGGRNPPPTCRCSPSLATTWCCSSRSTSGSSRARYSPGHITARRSPSVCTSQILTRPSTNRPASEPPVTARRRGPPSVASGPDGERRYTREPDELLGFIIRNLTESQNGPWQPRPRPRSLRCRVRP